MKTVFCFSPGINFQLAVVIVVVVVQVFDYDQHLWLTMDSF